jgi:multiple sugar transport system permease protein
MEMISSTRLVKNVIPVRTWLSQSFIHVILIALAALAVLPLFWSVFASFKSYKELVTSRDFFPHVWTLNNYVEILTKAGFNFAIVNSMVVSTLVTLSTLVTSTAVGYVFAKYSFPGRDKLFMLLLSTMMLPFAVVLVPLYVMIVSLNLTNELGGVIVVALWSTFGMFMMRQFMASIPSELIDAARIDGAGELRIFLGIVVPLSTAPMSALAVFTFLGSWDNYLWPLVVLSSPQKQTLPILLAGLRSLYWTRYDMWTAGSMLTVIPVMILYVFASKYFIRGVAMTGIKA